LRPIASIDPHPQLQLRQALIRRLRVLPAIFSMALISGIAMTLLERLRHGLVFRCAGLHASLCSSRSSTVPINQGFFLAAAALR
jgi:hypothetical protein